MNTTINRLLIFSVCQTDYIIELRTLSEVMDPTEIFQIPFTPPYFIGAMNAHGSPVTVLDLAAFIGIGKALPDGKILLLDQRIANLALWVDRVTLIVSKNQILETEEVNEDFTSKILLTDKRPLKLLNLETLLARLEKEINSNHVYGKG